MDLAKIRKKAKSSAGEPSAPAAPPPQIPKPEAKPQTPVGVATATPAAAPPSPARKRVEVTPPPAPRAEDTPPILPKPIQPPTSSGLPQTPAPAAPPPPRQASPEPDDTISREPSGRLEKLLVFTVGPRRYAIPIHDISQIIEDQGVTPVPHAPDFLLGIFSLRGRIVSVIDSARRLGIEGSCEVEAPKIVVLDAGEELIGIRVHAIDQVVEVDIGSLEPPPESFQRQQLEFVEGVFHHKERTISFLNLPLFLAFETGGASS